MPEQIKARCLSTHSKTTNFFSDAVRSGLLAVGSPLFFVFDCGRNFLYFSHMIHQQQNIFILLAICFVISLVWCGDISCLNGTSDENCSSLLCNLSGNHSSSSDSAQNNSVDNCTCVCHTPTVTGQSCSVTLFLHSQNYCSEFTFHIPSSPNRLLYRPPLVA
jgi:hypothetical protein